VKISKAKWGIGVLSLFSLCICIALSGCSSNMPEINWSNPTSSCHRDIPKDWDTDPVVLEWYKPAYPELARRDKKQGIVIVIVTLGPNGEYLKGDICSGPNPMLNKAALTASRHCRYTGAQKNGKGVPSRLKVPFAFRLH